MRETGNNLLKTAVARRPGGLFLDESVHCDTALVVQERTQRGVESTVVVCEAVTT
jgi:hypothetical protein